MFSSRQGHLFLFYIYVNGVKLKSPENGRNMDVKKF